MQLQYVTMTGADDATAISTLNDIAAEYPFVEFAILLLPEQMGQNRCPTMTWIDDFKNNYEGDHKAMHLCGSALLGFINDDKTIFEMMDGFKRIQLNLKFGDVDGKYDDEKLITQIKNNPAWDFIIQYTDDEKRLLPSLKGIPNHALLFDGSAGQGVSPDQWPVPLPGHTCGYAGGLNPENIEQNLEKIAAAAPGYDTWIDMETGVRTNDKFDTDKIVKVLKASKTYIK